MTYDNYMLASHADMEKYPSNFVSLGPTRSFALYAAASASVAVGYFLLISRAPDTETIVVVAFSILALRFIYKAFLNLSRIIHGQPYRVEALTHLSMLAITEHGLEPERKVRVRSAVVHEALVGLVMLALVAYQIFQHFA